MGLVWGSRVGGAHQENQGRRSKVRSWGQWHEVKCVPF